MEPSCLKAKRDPSRCRVFFRIFLVLNSVRQALKVHVGLFQSLNSCLPKKTIRFYFTFATTTRINGNCSCFIPQFLCIVLFSIVEWRWPFTILTNRLPVYCYAKMLYYNCEGKCQTCPWWMVRRTPGLWLTVLTNI
jgi:hypothetical protein